VVDVVRGAELHRVEAAPGDGGRRGRGGVGGRARRRAEGRAEGHEDRGGRAGVAYAADQK
jgi:hypothetical protein